MRFWLDSNLQGVNQKAGKLLLFGLAGALFFNWRQWQRDKLLLPQKSILNRPGPFEAWNERPLVSVLVAAWDESVHIREHIESFLSLNYPNKQLVIVAGGEDGTYELVAQYNRPDIIVLRQRIGDGKQKSLQRAYLVSTGSIIYLTDADCLLDEQSFEACLRPLILDGEQVCTGLSIPLAAQRHHPFIISQASSQYYAALHLPAYAAGILGRNCALRREVLERCGAFNTPAPTGTDYILAKEVTRLCVAIRQNPESCIATAFPTTVRAYLRQQRRWIYNVLENGSHYGAIKEVIASAFTAMVGICMLVLPFATILFGPVCLSIWVVLFFNVWLSRIRYWQVFWKVHGRKNISVVVFQPFYMLIDFVAWIIPLLEFFPFKKRFLW